jgi:hypothetical protein
MRRVAVYTVIGCVAFLLALTVRTRHNAVSARVAAAAPPPDAPDSVQLAAVGVRPGAQLVAYVFGGSRCGFCQKRETKEAFAALRHVLAERHLKSGAYASVSVVGVAVNTNLHDGLGYLESIGPDAFDEISVGSGWQNENIIRLIRQQHVAPAAVPMVIVVTRQMAATVAPLTLTYGVDSVVMVLQGSDAIARWVREGASLVKPTPIPGGG